jgi:SnoaL-like domain
MEHNLDRLEMSIARSEIAALSAEFAYLIDHDLSERVADLFTKAGSYGVHEGKRSVGRAEIRAAYAARVARGLRTARHVFTNLRLTFESPDRVGATSILTLFADDGAPPRPAEVNLVADYEDVIVREPDGVWRYDSRTIVAAFVHPGGKPAVLPLGEAKAH